MNCSDPLLEYEQQCELHTKNTHISNTHTDSGIQKEFINLDQYCTQHSHSPVCSLVSETPLSEGIQNQENSTSETVNELENKKSSPVFSDISDISHDEDLYAIEEDVSDFADLIRLRDELAEEESYVPPVQVKKKPSRVSEFFWHWTRVSLAYFLLSGTIFGILMGLMNFSAYSARIVHWIQPEKIENLGHNMQKALVHSTPQVHAGESEPARHEEVQREVVEEKILIEYPDMVFDRSYNEENLLSGLSTTSASKASFSLVPKENRIIIPRLGKNIPLVDVEMRPGATYETMNDVFMEELKKGIVRYPGTAKPGQKGNAFIFGHSSNYPWIPSKYNDVFALLDKLQNGDEIIAYYDGKKYIYKVSDRAIVKPGDVKVLQSRDPNKKEIALMTCWPIGTTLERIIIFGELVEES